MIDISNLNSGLAMNTHVVEMSIRVDQMSGRYDLRLNLAKSPSDGVGLALVFEDVAELSCSLDLAGWAQLHMLGIREIRQGYERPFVADIPQVACCLT
jgi:hypothetical protein